MNDRFNGTEQRSGIRTLDPHTNNTTTLLCNYFDSIPSLCATRVKYSYHANVSLLDTVDYVCVDSTRAILFTDPQGNFLLSPLHKKAVE